MFIFAAAAPINVVTVTVATFSSIYILHFSRSQTDLISSLTISQLL